MNNKGIVLFLLVCTVFSAAPILSGASPGQGLEFAGLEERIELRPAQGATALGPVGSPFLPPGERLSAPVIGAWTLDGAVAAPGYQGGSDYILGHDVYIADSSVDLLLHFDEGAPVDAARLYSAEAKAGFSIETGRALLGKGAGSFRGPGSALSLKPGQGSLFGRDSRFRDFSIEFWLYPANGENGEVILSWQSVRNYPGGVLPERLSCVIAGGRVSWVFDNFFEKPLGPSAKPENAAVHVELRARSPLVPLTWSHHLLRFDGDTGLLEYLVDGETESTAYATPGGREALSGGTVYTPAIGAAAALVLGEDYAGLVDEFRLSRTFVEKPKLSPFGRDSGLVLSPVVDLGFGHSRLTAVDAIYKTPGSTSIEFAYRLCDTWAGWSANDPAWIPFRPGEALPGAPRGRYVQVCAELYPDGRGRTSPLLSSLVFRYEPDPPPPPPARLSALPKDGAIELRWTPVPEADIAGYLIYYGDAPGEYFGTGAAEGPSPIDAGMKTSLALSGLANGRLVYVAVAAYDSAAASLAGSALSRATTRAGEFSPEISARPSRTAR